MSEIINSGVLPNHTAFVGPSICCDREGFELTDVLNAGYLNESRAPNMALITVQRYPANNCQLNGVINPQDIFSDFLNHTSAQALTNDYAADIAMVRGSGKDVIMLEMNSASCGGFPGLSDSFGVAMWCVVPRLPSPSLTLGWWIGLCRWRPPTFPVRSCTSVVRERTITVSRTLLA
jgi:hypothetical protein